MAKNGSSRWGNLRPGRRPAHTFDRLVSPLGENCAEVPVYSPSTTVEGAIPQKRGAINPQDKRQGLPGASKTFIAKDQRRGG